MSNGDRTIPADGEEWLDRLAIRVPHADLFEVGADALACPVTVELGPYGKISQRLFELATPGLMDALSAARKRLPGGRLQLGEAIALASPGAYASHLVFVALWDHSSEYSATLLYKAYANALRCAATVGAHSVVLPIMRYAGAAMAGEQLARVIIDMAELKRTPIFQIGQITIASQVDDDLDTIRRCLDQTGLDVES